MKKSLAAAIAVASLIGLGVTSMASPQPPGQPIAVPKAEVAIVEQIAPDSVPQSITLVTQVLAPSKAVPVAGIAFAVQKEVIQGIAAAVSAAGSTHSEGNHVTQGAPPSHAAFVAGQLDGVQFLAASA